MFGVYYKTPYICTRNAEIAQLVEHNLAKVRVASSSLVFRSKGCPDGGIGRHEGLKILWPEMAVRVQVPLRVHKTAVNHLIFSRFYFAGYKQGINKRQHPYF